MALRRITLAVLVAISLTDCHKANVRPLDTNSRAAAEWVATAEALRLAVRDSWAGRALQLACIAGFSQVNLPSDSLVIADISMRVTKDLDQCRHDSSSFVVSATGGRPAVLVTLKATRRGERDGLAVVTGEWYESGTSSEDFECTVAITQVPRKVECKVTGSA